MKRVIKEAEKDVETQYVRALLGMVRRAVENGMNAQRAADLMRKLSGDPRITNIGGK